MIDDRYTALVKAAYEAQQAREGEEYKAITANLANIDTKLEELKARREEAVLALESMDAAVVAAQEALQAHFAGSATPAAPEPETPADEPSETVVDVEQYFRPIFGTQADEFSSSRANGAYAED